MKNQYDAPDFFRRYGEMARSRGGLDAAGEWHELRRLLPDLAGKRVLDLGCGYGWHCRYAADAGAAEVVGVDASERMLDRARADTPQPSVRYLHAAIEDLRFPDGAFDLVLSSLAFHYVADLPAVCRRAAGWLAAPGDFVFSIEHPVFTAEGGQDWVRDGDGTILHWPVDRYFEEGERRTTFLGATVAKRHRTLAAIVNAVLDAGFRLERLVEPQPPEWLLDSHPDMPHERRRPMMLLIAAKKPRDCPPPAIGDR